MARKRRIKSNITNRFYSFLSRLLITGLFTVCCLICLKGNSSFKQFFYDKFLSNTFNFSYFNDLYKKYLGDAIPFGNLFSKVEPVFSEKIVYSDFNDYLDGVSLSVGENYLVPVINSGLVIYVGDKDGYGNTVIIKQSDGVDVWYSNLNSVDVKMYSYVSGGNIIGNCSNNLYLVFKKDGNILDYKKYI